jgi:hypothetical protein
MTNLGVAYVCFARDNPALYRVMYDRSRDKDALPDQLKDDGAYCQVRNTITRIAAAASPRSTWSWRRSPPGAPATAWPR